MPRRAMGFRGRGKTIIRVFCEGESEQAYTQFLKQRFSDVASIKYPKETGLFEEAERRFAKDPQYRDNAEVIDEVWFFFDIELKDAGVWEQRLKKIEKLRRLRKNPPIRVRLLMTTGCIEYWLMLHYRMLAPPVQTPAEKAHMLERLVKEEPAYKKGDVPSIAKIAARYPTALDNAEASVKNLLAQGLPGCEDTDERNRWLCENCFTFSTVYEAIRFLESLSPKTERRQQTHVDKSL